MSSGPDNSGRSHDFSRGSTARRSVQSPLVAEIGELSEREELVLRYIVQHYILTANPVGSRFLSKRMEETSLSPASIRNVMADLEEKGVITHPHTSAGRLPTDLGYRLYVDMLVRIESLTSAEKSAIEKQLDTAGSHSKLVKETSRLVAAISSQLGVVTAPRLLDSRLERIELVRLASDRVMVILSMSAGIVKTVMLEIQEELSREQADQVAILINERLAGLTIREIRNSYRDRLGDLTVTAEPSGLVRVFIESADEIFNEQVEGERIHVAPALEILQQPEFTNPDQVRGIVELMQNEEIVIHLLEGRESESDEVRVTIGSELQDERMADYSMITTQYRVGETKGTIGLIGPKRMNYARLMAVVGYVANTVTSQLEDRS